MKKILKSIIVILILIIFSINLSYAAYDFHVIKGKYSGLEKIAYNGDVLVAVSYSGQLTVSNDLETFTYIQTGIIRQFTELYWTGEEFIAVSAHRYYGNKVAISKDGYNWRLEDNIKLTDYFEIKLVAPLSKGILVYLGGRDPINSYYITHDFKTFIPAKEGTNIPSYKKIIYDKTIHSQRLYTNNKGKTALPDFKNGGF